MQEGDPVAEDDLLVRFDPTDVELAVQQAEAALAQAEAQLAQLAAAQSQQLQAEDAHDATMKCFTIDLPGGEERKICPALGTYEELARFQMNAANDTLAAEEARAELEPTEIRAPFAGTVVEVTVNAGDTAGAGEVVAVVAVLDRLQVVTVDLTELDVARVAEGQAVVVTVDALPGVEMAGHVDRIGLRSQEYRGDVVYPVVVALEEGAPGLRWGMTTMVEIEEK